MPRIEMHTCYCCTFRAYQCLLQLESSLLLLVAIATVALVALRFGAVLFGRGRLLSRLILLGSLLLHLLLRRLHEDRAWHEAVGHNSLDPTNRWSHHLLERLLHVKHSLWGLSHLRRRCHSIHLLRHRAELGLAGEAHGWSPAILLLWACIAILAWLLVLLGHCLHLLKLHQLLLVDEH